MSETPKDAAISLVGGCFVLAVIGVVALIGSLGWIAWRVSH